MKAAKQHGVQCVGEDFLDEVKTADVATALLLIKKKSISEWGEDVSEGLCLSFVWFF